MGVRGLFGYFNEYERDCYETCRLSDTIIVVDGWNLMHSHFSYHKNNNLAFGGDYNTYYNRFKQLFAALLKCNITPIVILDGGLKKQDTRWETVMERRKDRLLSGLYINPQNDYRHHAVPGLIAEVFISVLQDTRITFVTCPYDADQHIATIAKALGRPILSNDSDFVIFGGDVISVNSVVHSLSACTNLNYISCEKINLDKFFRKHRLNPRLFPLLGTVLGNDHAPSSLFTEMFTQIALPTSRSMSYQHRHIIGLLRWLGQQTLEDAISKLLKYIPKTERSAIEQRIHSSLASYGVATDALVVRSLAPFLTQTEAGQKILACHPEPKDSNLMQHLICEGKLDSRALQIIQQKFVFCAPLVEDEQSPAAASCALPIVHFIVDILLQHDQKIEIFIRDRKEFVQKTYYTKKTVENIGLLCDCDTVFSLNYSERRKLLLHALQGNDCCIQDVPENLQFYCLLLAYWVMQSKLGVKIYHLYAILTCLIKLFIVERILKKGNKNMVKCHGEQDIGADCIPVSILLKRITRDECLLFNQAIQECTDPTVLSHKYDKRTVHIFSEFQACYEWGIFVSKILGDPMERLHPHLTYNGFRINGMAVSFSQESGSVHRVLRNCPTILKLLDSLRDVVDPKGTTGL